MRTKSVVPSKTREMKSDLRLAKGKASSLIPPAETNRDKVVNHGPTLWQKARHAAGDKLAFSVKEAAESLGVSPWYIRDEMSQGHLSFSCPRGRQMIPRWELVRYLETNMNPGTLPVDDYDELMAAHPMKPSSPLAHSHIMS